MNSNKKITLLFIILFIILIGIGFYILKLKPKNDSSTTIIEENETQEQKTESTPIEKSKENKTPKNEIETKISISQDRFDEIKKYILSLDDNLLPSNLNINEKTKIEKIRNSIKYVLHELQNFINDEQKKIDDYNKKLNEIKTKKTQLEKQTTKIELEISDLENMLKRSQDYKKILEQDYEKSETTFDINGKLNKIYQITN